MLPGYAKSHLYFDVCLAELVFYLPFFRVSVFCCFFRLRLFRLMLLCDVHLSFSNARARTIRLCARATANFSVVAGLETVNCVVAVCSLRNMRINFVVAALFLFFLPLCFGFYGPKCDRRRNTLTKIVPVSVGRRCRSPRDPFFEVLYFFFVLLCFAVLSFSVFRTKDTCRNSLSAYCFSIILRFKCVCVFV